MKSQIKHSKAKLAQSGSLSIGMSAAISEKQTVSEQNSDIQKKQTKAQQQWKFRKAQAEAKKAAEEKAETAAVKIEPEDPWKNLSQS